VEQGETALFSELFDMRLTVTPQTDLIRDCFRGALLGTMIGDALGADMEQAPPYFLRDHLRDAPDYEAAMSPGGILHRRRAAPGTVCYTDDTQMTLGLAEGLVERGAVNEADLARRFMENFEGFRGYGTGAYTVILAWKSGASWSTPARELFQGNGSYGNGAAMRIAPIGLFYHAVEPHILRRNATRSAVLTHTHVLGIEGAVLQAAAIAQAVRAGLATKADDFDPLRFLLGVATICRDDCEVYLEGLDHIRHFLEAAEKPDPILVAETLGNGVDAMTAVPAALCAFLLNADSFVESVRFAVRMGGDCDTIGAMCGAIAGAYHGFSAIPTDWLLPLENGPKGRDYAFRLADDLFDRWQELSGTL
jgi:poly(ADP-ribose) glycohydrolase ARH3